MNACMIGWYHSKFGKLADEFSITQKPCPTCAGVLLELDPLKADPRFRLVRLEVDPKTAQVLKSTVIDPDGSQNAICARTSSID